MYMPYNGKEERLTNYEVLVHKKPKRKTLDYTFVQRDNTLLKPYQFSFDFHNSIIDM